MDAAARIWYFGNFVADLRPDGEVEYAVHVEYTEAAVNKLHEALHELLDAAN